MEHTQLLKYIFLIIPLTFIITILILYLLCKRKYPETHNKTACTETDDPELGDIINNSNDKNTYNEELMCFQGGEDLTIPDILDAPGEVIGKSSYGTLYMANLTRNNSIFLLRFLRPACCGSITEVVAVVHAIGLVRHTNLVPLKAFYMGPRGEKLLVHPFFAHPNLAQVIKDGNNESHKWDVVYSIALGLVKGLAYLHTGLHKSMIHGNLKSKNVLLGPDFQPYISDYGLHLLLNPTAGQEMLETSAVQGYKAPELIKMKDISENTDIYSLGIVLLELLTGKEPFDTKSSNSHEIYLPNIIRRAILDHRIKDMYHPDILYNQTGKQRHVTEDRALKLVQLAMTCCSPSPSLRPQASEVARKVEEIGKEQTVQCKRT